MTHYDGSPVYGRLLEEKSLALSARAHTCL